MKECMLEVASIIIMIFSLFMTLLCRKRDENDTILVYEQVTATLLVCIYALTSEVCIDGSKYPAALHCNKRIVY